MLNLLPKSGMSDVDERSYSGSTAEEIVIWSLSFGVEIVIRGKTLDICLLGLCFRKQFWYVAEVGLMSVRRQTFNTWK